MVEHPLNKQFVAIGDWFLPEEPARRIAGTLTYSLNGATLELHDALKRWDGSSTVLTAAKVYPLIYGTTNAGDLVTVVKAMRTGISFNIALGPDTRQPEQLASARIFIGIHLSSNAHFKTLHFRFPGLQVWLERRVVDFQPPTRDEASGKLIAQVRIESQSEEVVPLPNIGASLRWGFATSLSPITITSASIATFGWVSISPNTPQPFEWHLDQLERVFSFLTFIAGTPMSPDVVNAIVDDSQLSVLIALHDLKWCTYTHVHEFFMSRSAMGVDLAAATTRWFQVAESVLLPARLAASVLASESLALHVEFLSLMQALEGMHRALHDQTYMGATGYQAVYSAMVNAIPGDIDSEHRTALKERLKYGNEISLRKRLNRLAELLSTELRELILGDVGKIPAPWMSTRNFFTHWDDALRDESLNGQDLYHANIRLRAFLRVLYLNLIGVPQPAIVKALGNTSAISQHLIQINATDRAVGNQE